MSPLFEEIFSLEIFLIIFICPNTLSGLLFYRQDHLRVDNINTTLFFPV